MMRAGKEYVGGMPEYEDRRSAHLRELLQTIKAQAEPAETEEAAPVEVKEPVKPEQKSAAKLTNQNKPTLKLR